MAGGAESSLRLGGRKINRIVHVSKRPPSSSAVALYGSYFGELLAQIARTTVGWVPAEPRETQTFRAALTGLVRGLRAWRDVDLVHVELSGRGLAEFFTAVGLVMRRRGPGLSVTCHDVPSIVGAPLMFAALDRRGLRRMGARLSVTVGSHLERLVLCRCDVVLALTEPGAADLQSRYGRPVAFMPLLLGPTDQVGPKADLVFVPGYVGGRSAIGDVVAAVGRSGSSRVRSWAVAVGPCSEEAEAFARQAAAEHPHVQVTFTGFVDEAAFLDLVRQARIVVRPHAGTGATNAFAASSLLAWAAARGCICLTDDDREGTVSLARDGLVEVTTGVATRLVALLDGSDDLDARAHQIARQMQARAGDEVVLAAFRAAFDDLPNPVVDVGAA